MPIYVLWIPCLEDVLTIRETKISKYNISDTDVSLINAEIDNTWQITFSYRHNEEDQTIVLAPYRPAKAGFLYYTLVSQTERETRLGRSLHEKFHQGLYHIIKSFFHKHIHHPKEEDSILHARFYPSEEAFLAETKGDAEFYVEEYLKKFTYLSNDIVDCLSEIAEMESTEWKRIFNYLNIYAAYKRLTDKLSRYEGEYIYYQALRKSVGSVLRNATAYDRRMSLLDQEIRIKLHCAENAFNYNSSIIGTNVSSLGLCISIISLVLAIVIACFDRSDEQLQMVSEQVDGIRKKEELQNKDIYRMLRCLDVTAGKVDTLIMKSAKQDSTVEVLNRRYLRLLRQSESKKGKQ